MTARIPRRVIERAKTNADLNQETRAIIDHGGGYFDAHDTPAVRRRFGSGVVATVTWDGRVEKIKQKKARRAK